MIGDDIQKEIRAAVDEFADRLIRYYDNLGGSTASGLVAYHVQQVKKDMFGEGADPKDCLCPRCREKTR